MKSSLEQLKEKLLKNNNYKKEINKQDLPFEIAERIIDARIKKGMTQAELAKKLKTKQSGIARLESGRNYPSLKNLEKIAQILDIRCRNPLGQDIEMTTNCYFKIPSEFFNHNMVVEQKSNINNTLYNL